MFYRCGECARLCVLQLGFVVNRYRVTFRFAGCLKPAVAIAPCEGTKGPPGTGNPKPRTRVFHLIHEKARTSVKKGPSKPSGHTKSPGWTISETRIARSLTGAQPLPSSWNAFLTTAPTPVLTFEQRQLEYKDSTIIPIRHRHLPTHPCHEAITN